MLFQKLVKQLLRPISLLGFTSIFLITTFSKVFALSLSPEIGKIQESRAGWNGKTLILIQEAHADYEGQKATIKILEALISQKSLRLIMVEGGWDNVSLSDLRMYGDAEGRRKVAEQYLKSGKITGEEYLDIVGEHDLELWGIEDPALYEENMKAFLAIHEAQPAALAALGKFESNLEAQARKVFSKELLEFEDERKAFHNQKTSLLAYLSKKVPPPLKVPAHIRGGGTFGERYPRLAQIMELSGNSQIFDADKVELEKQALIKTLTRKASKLEMEPVRMLEGKKNPESELEMISTLFEIASGNSKHQTPNSKQITNSKTQTPNPNTSAKNIGGSALLSGGKFSNLKAYRDALEKTKDMDFKKFFQELEQLESEIVTTLIKTPEEKDLYQSIRYAETLRKLFELKMTPEEYQELIAHSSLLIANHEPRATSHELQSFIPIASAFYESALKREKALIENTLKRMKNASDSAGVLIAGGFHSDRLIDALHKQGYTVLSVTPKFQPEDSEKTREKYFQILKSKWEGDAEITKKQDTRDKQ